jgi:hypothetical protein
MFDAGAIDLLLSKPVSRSLLFLTKFFGGCAFVLLNGAYFIVGLWLIVGWRFGIWNHRLLLCIPVFLFLFVVYYAVSAAAAVRWKNAIVSVVITVLFWVVCFTVGAAKHGIEGFFLRPVRITTIIPADDSVMVVNRSGIFAKWQNDDWEAMCHNDDFGPPFGPQGILGGPIREPKKDEVLYFRKSPGRHHSFFGSTPNLQKIAWKDGAWVDEAGPELPSGASWLFMSPEGQPMVLATAGVYRIREKTDADKEKPKLWGMTLPFGGPQLCVPLGPKQPFALASPFSAAMNPVSGDIVVYSAGKIVYLRRNKEGAYLRGAERELDEPDNPAALAFAGDTVVVAPKKGTILLLDAADLATRAEVSAGGNEPNVAQASPDGQSFAVLYHNEKMVLFDAEGNIQKRFSGASAVAFGDDGELFVADRDIRVIAYDLKTLDVVERYEPPLDVLQRVYRYFLEPFYTIFPKPGELDNVVNYLLTDKESVSESGPVAGDLRESRVQIDIWGPIWSSLAFVVVVLAFTCFYIHRMDF